MNDSISGEASVSEWHESPPTGSRWREVYGPFVCEAGGDGKSVDPAVFYCDDCGDCMACSVNEQTWDDHDHRAIEYEDGLTARDRS
jgi:hypothetical protein